MVPLTVIGGYLGAGKTTLVNHLLRDAGGRRLALVVNDFGALNIDADLIESRGEEQVNLTNGCICCGMSDGFDAALDDLLALAPPPDHIIVEASGVADVGVLGRYGHLPGLSPDGVLVLADATQIRRQADDRYIGSTIKRQLRAANLIIATKVDLLAAGQKEPLEDWLREQAGATPTLYSDASGLPLDLILGALPTNGGQTSGEANEEHHAHPHYVSWSYREDGAVTTEQLDAFTRALPDSAVRVKGVINVDGARVVLQRTGLVQELTPTDQAATETQLVAIGLREQFDPATMDRAARHLSPAATP